MKSIRYCLFLTLCGLFLVWALHAMSGQLPSGFFGWRALLIQGSGILAIGSMSVAMLLAVRPVVLEKPLNGLDKMYRLHKWLGISALIFAVMHWFIVNLPKWNLFDFGPRGRRPAGTDLGLVEQFFRGLRHQAESVGEIAFYIAVVLIILALLRRFPYHLFFKTHHFFAFVYLVLVFHSVILIRFSYWTSAVGVLMGLLMLGGTISALIIIFPGVGKKRQMSGKVVAVDRYEDIGFLSLEILPDKPWKTCQAGQFAFIAVNGSKEAHPFTIASAMRSNHHLRFVIKGLGDGTRQMAERLKVGDPVRLEGPYGRFDFSGKASRQIWVAGGIGITPFMARLEALAQKPDGRAIDLFFCAAAHNTRFIEELSRLAEAAKVRLHVRQDGCDGFLDAIRIAKIVPEWQEADFWFCGPAGFGKALKSALVVEGLADSQFHQELFEMR